MCSYSDYLREKNNRIETEKSLAEAISNLHKIQEKYNEIKDTKNAIFNLQDLIMRLIKFKKIDKREIEVILNILRNTGVEECDIKILCHLEEPKKPRR